MRRVALIAGLILGGCTVGPDYHPPNTPIPPAFQGLPAKPTDMPFSQPLPTTQDLSHWWQRFNDAELNSLIDRALKKNLDLLTAASRVREAREQIVIAGAAGLPKVNLSADHAHLHSNTSFAEKLGIPNTPPGASDNKFYSLGFDATWEVDIFGGVRRTVESADASSEATVWQMHDGEVSLTAEIATDYFTLRATQARIAMLNDAAASQRGVLQLTAARALAGFVTKLDVDQQTSLVASTVAQIPALQAQTRAMEHAIAVLLGAEPESLTAELHPVAVMPAVPATLPVGLPSDLLRRRPDIREAERKLASATAEVGVATADLYPKFNLIGAVNFSSSHLSDLLSGSNLGEVGIGAIMWPVFQGGKIHANIRAKDEEAKQAYYAYQKTLLAAVQNVEDAFARYAADQQSLVARQQSEASARSSVAIAGQQYKVGMVTYVNVLNAQANELQARDQLEQANQSLATDLASLFKALGGGWQVAAK